MDIFKIHAGIIKEYRSYISSFINIADERIRAQIEKDIADGKLWPEPLIQFNPSYEITGSIDSLCEEGLLHEEMRNIFKGYNLYRHQIEAVRAGAEGKDFVVTSGTGSGKSLTFLGTIFNYLLKHKQGTGIKAIIVYPMNALINSQSYEIEELRRKYKEITNKDFPISFAQYTGQEKEDRRKEIRESPPDIILTNYMMLELILTRKAEEGLRASVYKNLKYLVFDELHTYRGRQGSDVALLIRRIKARCEHEITFIGTSATMVSGGSNEQQKATVARVASLFFGKTILPEQVINESLVRSFDYSANSLDIHALRKSVDEGIRSGGSEAELVKHPLAIWLENEIALAEKNGILIRNKPYAFVEIVRKLSEAVNIDAGVCEERLLQLFKWINGINATKKNLRDAYLPYRLHQFISQTGSVYVSLDPTDDRMITLEPGIREGNKETGRLLYPVVFSRFSGYPFICVLKNREKGVLQPREFNEYQEPQDAGDGEGERPDLDSGYLIIGDDIWNEDEDIAALPEAWLNRTKGVKLSIIKKYRSRMPQKIFFNAAGRFSEEDKLDFEGWFMPARLLFDPTSGTFFDTKTSERTKLANLGSEGRSTSTTVLSLLILMEYARNGIDPKDQKVLSFTDNRQDAALQAGHFNDFLDVVELRSSIYSALRNAPGNVLDHSNIGQAVFDVLGLEQEDFATKPATFPSAIRDNENALKDYITYRVLSDLRRGWRVVLPNLEQCALLEISYKNLDENCRANEPWKSVPLLNEMSHEERQELVYQVLDFIRKAYAISSEEYLSPEAIDRKSKSIYEKLKSPWKFESDEEIRTPFHVAYEPIKGGRNIFIQSIGSRSALGRYLKAAAKEHDIVFNDESYFKFIESLCDLLCDAGWLKSEKAFNYQGEPAKIFQLGVDVIEWRLGDGKNVKPDLVKTRSYKRDRLSFAPNAFFQKIYKTDFNSLKKLRAGDHTGQVPGEIREQRENDFKDGILSALFCSPTMELGINISTLSVVHMRNVPPNPANYAQRGGRAGRSGQSALVFTFCSSFSPHDRHYFAASGDMVAGVVAPPQIDITNEELLRTHLHSIYLSEIGSGYIGDSIKDLVVDFMEDPKQPLKADVRRNMECSQRDRDRIVSLFYRVIEDIGETIKRRWWFTEDWVADRVADTIEDFDRAFDRWRVLHEAAQIQFDDAARIKKSGMYKTGSEEMRRAAINERQAERQIALLCNKDTFGSLSEFYPYRYLASEGFLPGYNFTRLPVRSYIPQGDSGIYISRPRFIALREFGPRNVIYYNGAKYQISQLLVAEAEKQLREAKISLHSGYCLMDEESAYEVCPLTGESLEGGNRHIITNLLEMTETRTVPRERISCEEEERLSQGFDVDVFFNVPGGIDRVRLGRVKNDSDDFLNVRYIPAARLIQINRSWKTSREEGFLMGMRTGVWKRESDLELADGKEEIKRVRLFATDTADALYIEPIEALALKFDGVVTLQYALKRAIESHFQVEPAEIGVSLMGDPAKPNIFLYEAAEGSLGILSQFVDSPDLFFTIARKAYDICRYDDESYEEPASYNDLLSYYNQRDHYTIDRFLIKDALLKLMACRMELLQGKSFGSYEEQYAWLLERYDKSSPIELKFLEYLHAHGLRLPDDAQRTVPGIYVKPDFYYDPNIWVFCDGPPHDDPAQKDRDRVLRRAIMDRGDQVIEYYYKDDMEGLVKKRPDIFRKVR